MEKSNETLIATSDNLIELTKLLNEFFYSKTYEILEDLTVIYSKGINTNVIVKKKKTGFYLYLKTNKN